MPESPLVLLLASGGIDSTALLDFYIRNDSYVECIHFQYNQPNAKSERKAFENIIKHYHVKGGVFDLKIPMAQRNDELIGRNVFFVLGAGALGISPSRISIGIHSDSEYYDCTKEFLFDCQRILDGYYAGLVKVEAPFIDFTKVDIIKYCKKYDVPLNMTYSCFRQNNPPCGKCPSCQDRLMINEA